MKAPTCSISAANPPVPTPCPSILPPSRSAFCRVLRVLRKLRPEAVISIDTYHAATARAALDEGVEIINDVSGLLWDPDMATVLAAERPGAILMHTRGAPRMWATLPPLPHEEVLPLVLSGLTHTLTLASDAGIPPATIVLDPGFGFGKRLDENFVLLRQFAALAQFGLPLLGAISRKRFLVAHIPHPTPTNRLETTCAGNVALILAGAHLLRVHDIHAARTAADTADAILRGGGVQPSF